MKIKNGTKVMLVNINGLKGYEILKQLKKGKIYTVDYVKSTGGLILKEIKHSTNYFGNIQGIKPERFKVITNKSKRLGLNAGGEFEKHLPNSEITKR